jgi:two-component system, NtrC family, response regulator AlgB
MARILIVDDEKNIRTHLATYFRGLRHEVEIVASGDEAIRSFERFAWDVVFSDVRMAGMDGMALLREATRIRPDAIVVLMTAYATVSQAVEAMKAGAYDYLPKPFSLDQVGLVLDRVLEVQRLRRENRGLRDAVSETVWLEPRSPAMRRALDTARQAAASDVTVLLTGESGTGKTMLARQMHLWSGRAKGPFATISCTTLAEHLLESELFGHVKGAFTGAWKDKPGRIEAARGGTLFLDEVGELSPELQTKFLRFMDDSRFERVGGAATVEVDARVIAATNRDLQTDVQAGRFREDLFYRLNVVAIELPALRERREDISALIDHLLARISAKHQRSGVTLAEDTRRLLVGYDWPGNVRELVNVIERALVLSPADTITADVLPDRLLAPAGTATGVRDDRLQSLEEIERAHIRRALAESPTLEEAAERLGIDVTTLWRKRKRWGLE